MNNISEYVIEDLLINIIYLYIPASSIKRVNKRIYREIEEIQHSKVMYLMYIKYIRDTPPTYTNTINWFYNNFVTHYFDNKSYDLYKVFNHKKTFTNKFDKLFLVDLPIKTYQYPAPIEYLIAQPNLTHLQINNDKYQSCLSVLDKVVSVTVIKVNNLDDMITNYLPNISTLNLTYTWLFKFPLFNYNNLTYLDISNNMLKSLNGIEAVIKLETLIANNNFITSVEPLNKLTKLKTVNISNNQVFNISKMTELSLITLYGHNNCISSIVGLPTTITDLDLSRNSISDIRDISAMKALIIAKLQYNNILSVNIDDIKHIPTLDISNCNIRMIDNLQMNFVITHWNLSGNYLSLEQCEKCNSINNISFIENGTVDISNQNNIYTQTNNSYEQLTESYDENMLLYNAYFDTVGPAFDLSNTIIDKPIPLDKIIKLVDERLKLNNDLIN